MDDVLLRTVNAILVMGQFPLRRSNCNRHDALQENLCLSDHGGAFCVLSNGRCAQNNKREDSSSDFLIYVVQFWLSECLILS